MSETKAKKTKKLKKPKKPGKNWKKFWKLGVEEFNTQFLGISKDGELTAVEGQHVYNLSDIAQKYGTPLQVVFPFLIEDRLKDLTGYFQAYMKIYGYKGKFFYHYPMKVNQNKEFILSLLSEGANLEATSANELWIVKNLWEREKFNSKIRVLCNGPKTDQYLDLIEELRGKGMNIVPIIESTEEVERLSKYKGDIGVRVDLNIKTDSHWDKKFDRFGLPEKDVLDLARMKNLKIMHYHLGSQIKTQKSILEGVRHAFGIYKQLQKTHPSLDTLDIGGGFGVPYEKKKFYAAKGVSSKIIKILKNLSDKAGIKHPNLVVEWGQYIVAPAEITIYKVLYKKIIPKANAKAWYIVDGSFMNDIKDTWAIHQKFHTIPVNNMFGALKTTWLAGSTCDSDDKYTAGGNYILLPKLYENQEQFVGILDTGAYQDGLASHHCLLSAPMRIIARDGAIKIVRKHESPDSIGKLFGWTNGDHK
jgi:arginine decarboxylase